MLPNSRGILILPQLAVTSQSISQFAVVDKSKELSITEARVKVSRYGHALKESFCLTSICVKKANRQSSINNQHFDPWNDEYRRR